MIGASLTIEDQIFRGWTSLQASSAIDAIAGEFRITAEQSGDIMIWPGTSAILRLENQVVCSGYVTGTNTSISGQDSELSLNGADKTVDLADCSVIAEPDEWFNLNLYEIAVRLCQPFKINVVNQVVDAGEVFKSFKIQPGESVFDALDRAAKARAVLVTSDNSGNLVLTRAAVGGYADDLVYGENILEASFNQDWSKRFSNYIVKNQTVMTDDMQETANVSGISEDLNVRRYRPLMMVVQNTETGAAVGEQAAWEACVRSGGSTCIEIVVDGWTQKNGLLWQKNTLSRVHIPRFSINARLLIKEVSFSLDNNGAKTRLSFVNPDAYKRLPVVKKTKDAGGLLPPDAIEIK